MLKLLAHAILADDMMRLQERALRAELRVEEQAAVIADLSAQLRTIERTPAPPASVGDLIEAFKTHALVESPFADGKVPEDLYLTPAYRELKRTDAA